MSNRRRPSPDARHWTAPDADEIIQTFWPGVGAVQSPRSLCDDGAQLLTSAERRLFDRALEEARQSADEAAHVFDGDLHMGVNLRTDGGVPARWALANRKRYLTGGFVDPLPAADTAPVPVGVQHRRQVHHHRGPTTHYDHRRNGDDYQTHERPLTLFGIRIR
jgi:hypothetical protein